MSAIVIVRYGQLSYEWEEMWEHVACFETIGAGEVRRMEFVSLSWEPPSMDSLLSVHACIVMWCSKCASLSWAFPSMDTHTWQTWPLDS